MDVTADAVAITQQEGLGMRHKTSVPIGPAPICIVSPVQVTLLEKESHFSRESLKKQSRNQ